VTIACRATRTAVSGTAAVGSLACSVPAGTATGDCLVIAAANSISSPQTLAAFLAAFDVYAPSAGGSQDVDLLLGWRFVQDGDPSSYTVSAQSGSMHYGIVMASYTGVYGVRAGSASASANTSTTSTNVPPANPAGTTDPDWVVNAAGYSPADGNTVSNLAYPSNSTYPGWSQRGLVNSAKSGKSSVYSVGVGLIDQLLGPNLPKWTYGNQGSSVIGSLTLIGSPLVETGRYHQSAIA
jgi:hypothetical protein